MADEERNQNEPVYMKHPDTDAIGGPVPYHAFRTVWRNKGWTEISVTLVEASRILEKDVVALNKLTRDELDIVARNGGLDPEGIKTNADVIALIEGNTTTTPAVSVPGGNV